MKCRQNLPESVSRNKVFFLNGNKHKYLKFQGKPALSREDFDEVFDHYDTVGLN